MICEDCIFRLKGEKGDVDICYYDGNTCVSHIVKCPQCFYHTDDETARKIVQQVFETALQDKRMKKAIKEKGIKL